MSGMSGTEWMHMLVYTGINPNDSVIEFYSADKKRYQKQAGNWTKSKGKHGRRCDPQACTVCQAPNKATPVITDTSNDILYPIKSTQWETLKGARRFSEVILSVLTDAKEVMARCLLDTGCTKSMILKKITDKKQQKLYQVSNIWQQL